MGTKTRLLPSKYSRPPPSPPSAAAAASTSGMVDSADEVDRERDYVPDTYANGSDREWSRDGEDMDPYAFDGRPMNSSHGGGLDSLDALGIQIRVCLRCDKRGQLLVCAEAECPVAIHEKCLDHEPKYDELGNYYCPYCLYKRATQKVERLRRKAMLAKQSLSEFLDGRVGGLKKVQKDASADAKRATSFPSGERNQGNNGVSVEYHGVAHQSTDEDQDCRNKTEVSGAPLEKEGSKDCSYSSSRDQSEESRRGVQVEDSLAVVDQTPKESSNTCRELIVFQSRVNQETSNTCHEAIVSQSGVNKTSTTCHEQVVCESAKRPETSGACQSNEKDRRKKQKRQHQTNEAKRPAEVTKVEISEVYPGPSSITGIPQATEPIAGGQMKHSKAIVVYPTNGRRARLEWSVEEETMLKEGVEKYRNSMCRNIPWKRILKDGCRVFDPARRADDLKSKWKNIERSQLERLAKSENQ